MGPYSSIANTPRSSSLGREEGEREKEENVRYETGVWLTGSTVCRDQVRQLAFQSSFQWWSNPVQKKAKHYNMTLSILYIARDLVHILSDICSVGHCRISLTPETSG